MFSSARLGWVLAALVTGFALFQTIAYVPDSGTPSPPSSSPPAVPPAALEGLEGRELGWVEHVLGNVGVAVGVASRTTVARGYPWDVIRRVADAEVGVDGRVRRIWVRVERTARPPLAMAETEGCRTSPARRVPGMTDPVIGRGPVTLGGVGPGAVVPVKASTEGTGGSFLYLVASPRYSGPLLVRGARIDGPGAIRFDQQPALGAGGIRTFGEPREMHLPRGRGLRAWGVTLEFSRAGCYALQVDGTGLHEQIVFETVNR
jgi:hypothetical protein